MDDGKQYPCVYGGLSDDDFALFQTKLVIGRLERTGWLEHSDPAAGDDPARLLATMKKAVLTTANELSRIIGRSRETLQGPDGQSKLYRTMRLLASEIELLQTGNEAKLLHSIGRKDKTNAPHYRRLNKAIASSHRILTEPVCVEDPATFVAREEGERPEFRSRMTKKKATSFILDVFASVGVERSEEWVRDEVKKFNRRIENLYEPEKTSSKQQKNRNQYVGAPSIIAHLHNCLSWKERADFELVKKLVRTNLAEIILQFLEDEKAYER